MERRGSDACSSAECGFRSHCCTRFSVSCKLRLGVNRQNVLPSVLSWIIFSLTCVREGKKVQCNDRAQHCFHCVREMEVGVRVCVCVEGLGRSDGGCASSRCVCVCGGERGLWNQASGSSSVCSAYGRAMSTHLGERFPIEHTLRSCQPRIFFF